MPQSALRFRLATRADVASILVLVHSAYRGDASRVGWTTEADLLDGQRTDPEEIEALIEAKDSQLIVCERAGELVANVLLSRAVDAAYVGMLAVRPELQAQGIARALLAEVERRVLADGLGTRVQMTVIAQRVELIAWYERRGYRVTGEKRPFPYGDARFGLPRRTDLYFCVLEKQLAAAHDPKESKLS
jgi:ribosomal protein S18 acetylase RimI-like enzyme